MGQVGLGICNVPTRHSGTCTPIHMASKTVYAQKEEYRLCSLGGELSCMSFAGLSFPEQTTCLLLCVWDAFPEFLPTCVALAQATCRKGMLWECVNSLGLGCKGTALRRCELVAKLFLTASVASR